MNDIVNQAMTVAETADGKVHVDFGSPSITVDCATAVSLARSIIEAAITIAVKRGIDPESIGAVAMATDALQIN